MNPITPMEALEVLMDTINGKQHSWREVNRAKEILEGFIKRMGGNKHGSD